MSEQFDEDSEHCYNCGYFLDSDDVKEVFSMEGYCSADCQKGIIIPCIKPLYDLMVSYIGEPDPELWDRRIYKGTACGAWLRVKNAITITIGSIVEGSDAEFHQDLEFPFTEEDLSKCFQWLEDECSYEWDIANPEWAEEIRKENEA
jgi:hypothetical protein